MLAFIPMFAVSVVLVVFYWVLLLLVVVLGWMGYSYPERSLFFYRGGGIILLILFVILGFAVFGNPFN